MKYINSVGFQTGSVLLVFAIYILVIYSFGNLSNWVLVLVGIIAVLLAQIGLAIRFALVGQLRNCIIMSAIAVVLTAFIYMAFITIIARLDGMLGDG